ncbi:MAG: ATP-dependent Clp protease ATP-binding subunit [Oscillospiraceae bacterium]|nr:ATP-dependent Clp protease ATP-binding subunit [Oscillospiraceae bacterium]
MLCSRCKKREAVVFINSMQGGLSKRESLCLVCAREMDVPQIKEYMEQMGITDDNIEEVADAMTGIADNFDMDMFKPGGTNSIPQIFNNIWGVFGGGKERASSESHGQKGDIDGVEGGDRRENSAFERRERIRANENQKKAQSKRKFLSAFCTDLTGRARDGKLDMIVGREKEISRAVQILCRRQKNNPCLIGEPGVGKTAIAEGLAQKIVKGEVPFQLSTKEVFLLDFTALVAGTQFRGQFESRMKGLIEEVKHEGNIILFIDEIHNMVGAGDSEGSSMNAANILKPALSRGEVQVVGATTFKEYRKYIEKDSALERRFQPVTVNEPTVEDTVEVLKGIKQYYEDHHMVKISDEMLGLCATLSERYINDRYLPDKAIDLLDEACAYRSIHSKELEGKLVKKKEIDGLEGEIKEIEDAAAPDFEKLAEKKSLLLRSREDLEAAEKKCAVINVEESDIAKVIELWTGIPANKIEESEFGKLARIEDVMKKRIIGQDKAVEAVGKAIRRTRVQLSRRRRPASFIFVGPTGVGKTELVKVINDELFNGTDTLIRLDMTEYMEKHAVSRLIGSPPGYVGYDEAGQLTEKVRRHPYSVILFDEIEKAHPDIMNLLLQILDEGKVNDAQGRSVNFENTIICMTSNAGSSDKTTGLGFNKTEGDISREKAMKALTDFLRPEFISRIDEIVVFEPLSKESYASVAGLMLSEMKEPLQEKGITLKYDKRVLTALAEKSYGKKYGARDIRSVIRTDIEDKIAETIVEHSGKGIDTIKLTALKEGLKVEAISC